jgi:hypothetical protein
MSVILKGQDKVLRKLKKLGSPERTFDKAVKKTVQKGFAEARKATLSKEPASKSFTFQGMQVTAKNLKTGATANAWQVKKVGDSFYQLVNNRKSGKYNIARLLDEGHGEIRPRQKKRLFMPLSRKGQNKPPGTVSKSLVYGEDFILLKRVRPRKGLNYIKKIESDGSRMLTKEIIRQIRKIK